MLRKALLATAASERVRELITVTPAARTVASRYVAGESIQQAVDVARALRAAGLLVTLDYLGEPTGDAQRAAATAAQYAHLLSKLAAEGLTDGGAVEVSVKPSALGLLLPGGTTPRTPRGMSDGRARVSDMRAAEGADTPSVLGQRVAAGHLERIAVAARDAGTTVTVDAEDHRTTDATLRMATALRTRFGSVASVVQAALRRTEADVRELAAPGTRIRLCKGGYAEPAGQAFAAGHEVDKSFARCLRILMAGPGYPMIATHDRRLIAITRSLALTRPADSFEYQMLYGVRPDEQRRLAASGARVRVYVPYGGDWCRYLIRRLAERPANLALFLRSLGSTA
ncbi:MAG TPA: proline dehydrogenase family protein [Trebonia sp.]|nr:proline dehydrogenase family protein [Trebonia sp.]